MLHTCGGQPCPHFGRKPSYCCHWPLMQLLQAPPAPHTPSPPHPHYSTTPTPTSDKHKPTWEVELEGLLPRHWLCESCLTHLIQNLLLGLGLLHKVGIGTCTTAQHATPQLTGWSNAQLTSTFGLQMPLLVGLLGCARGGRFKPIWRVHHLAKLFHHTTVNGGTSPATVQATHRQAMSKQFCYVTMQKAVMSAHP